MGLDDNPFFKIKIFTAIFLWIVTLASTCIPWYIQRYIQRSKIILSYGNCFAGGVVFGAMMLHVLPCICTITVSSNVMTRQYPIGLFFASVSFLLLFAVDRILLKRQDTGKGDETLIRCDYTMLDDNENASNCTNSGSLVRINKNAAFIFVFALSLHSFLEGLGLAGMMTKPEVISYVIGLISHKWLEAFALGLSIHRARFDFRTRSWLIFIYACLTPVGILLGMSIMGRIDVYNAKTGSIPKILSGLSVGSFIYVTFIEMIPPEFEILDNTSGYKFMCVVSGFLAMATFALLDIVQ